MILASTLLYPDSVNEQGELHHDPYVANLLSQAYVLLSRASSLPAAYEQAYKLASVCLALERSERQSMRVHFVAGTASIGLELNSEGLTHIDEAIELAAELPDPMAYAHLAYLASAVCARMFAYRQSVNYAKVSLGIIRYLGKDHPAASADPDLEINVLNALVASEFMLAEYTAALEYLDMAKRLSPLVPNELRSLGNIFWMEAQLLRWRGQPEMALQPALAAIDLHRQNTESPSSHLAVGRLGSIVTEISLDLAEAFPIIAASAGRAAYLDLARPHLSQAFAKAEETNDVAGLRLATLARARFDQVADRNVDRKGAIEQVIRQGRQDHDIAVLAQAYTTLGREYAALGQQESALSCYRRTLDIVSGTDIAALGMFARRGLLVAREMRE